MGIFDRLKRQPGRVAGYTKKVVAADEIQKGGQYIADLGKGLKTKSDRQETFENAYQRLNLSEDDLRSSYKYHTNRFLLFLGFLVISMLALVYFSITSPFNIFPVLGFAAVCLSQMFTASFRMMQIRHRELLPVIYWVKNTDEWWIRPLPKRSSRKDIRVRSKVTNKK